MAFTVNGVGTSVCKAGNSVTWDGQESFDAVECFVVAFLPIVPIRTIHTFDWSGINFRMAPIRWSAKLVGLAFLRRWLWGFAILGLIMTLIGFADFPKLIVCSLIGAPLGLAAECFLFALSRGNRGRACDIRRVLGPHNCGSSDPAVWNQDLLGGVKDAQTMFAAASFEEAVPTLIRQSRYADAMWAARLCAGLEDALEGERLTDLVLDHAEVQDGLAQIGDKSRLWQALFVPAGQTLVPAGEEPIVVTPAVDQGNIDQIQNKARRRDDAIQ